MSVDKLLLTVDQSSSRRIVNLVKVVYGEDECVCVVRVCVRACVCVSCVCRALKRCLPRVA
jgi:hypothetical protein